MAKVQNEHVEESIAYDYDFLVLNLPPQQAAALHPHASLSEVRFLPCFALLLSFQGRIQLDFDGIRMDDKVISWAARDSSKPGRNLGERWVIHASPQWSEEYFDTNAPELEKLLLDRFSTIFGISLPPTNFVKIHKWRFARPASNSELGCIVDQASELAYCGDWCQTARVEGAFLSGLATANEILNSKAR